MKTYEWTWVDVTETVFNSPNWCDNPQSELFDPCYDIQNFYFDTAGVNLKEIDEDTFEYIDDNGDKRIVYVISVVEV